jgi:hypothetical protein
MRSSNIVVVLSFLWLMVSFWNRNEIPRGIDIADNLLGEPIQRKTTRMPFTKTFEGVDYRVQPEYDYELYGMIVSYRQANDHLNMLDVCVVWGDNAVGDHLLEIDFWNGIFTCNAKTSDRDAWQAFRMEQLSNNHLLSDDDFIREQVSGVRVGDQIRVRGVLASYSSPGGGRRGTSTVRTDTGDGACETIFVESFDVIRPAQSGWRLSMYASLAVLFSGLVWRFSRPYRPYAGQRSG